MKNKTDYFDLILKIIITLLAILVIVWAIQLIFGGSPELSEFNLAIIILMMGFLFKIYRDVGEIKIETAHMSLGVKDGFNKIKDDLSSIKRKLNA